MAEHTTTNDIAELLREGNAALLAGDSATARQRFRQVLELDSEQPDAWIGLAGTARPYREKRDHLQRALAIDPQRSDAQAVLAHVQARLQAGEVLAPGGVMVREALPAADPYTPPPDPTPAPPATVLTCYVHPGRETGLRCTNCDRPICADCVRPAPVGQLCPECARARRPVNYQVEWNHLLLAGVITLIYSVLVTFAGLYLFGLARFFAFIIAFLVGPIAGNLLVRGLDRIMRSKRGRPLQLTVGICYGLGAAPFILLFLLAGSPMTSILLALFSGIAIASAIASLR